MSAEPTREPADVDLPIWAEDDDLESSSLPPAAPTSPADRLAQAAPSASPTAIPGLDPTPGPAPVSDPVAHPPVLRSVAARFDDPDTEDRIDWSQVDLLRTQASTRLADQTKNRIGMTAEARRELGRSIIMELLQSAVDEAVTQDRRLWSTDFQKRMAQAVYDALFDLGRLQPLVDDERIENIEVDGCDTVTLEFADGTLHRGPAVADSDEELTRFIEFVGTRSKSNPRPFSESRPSLHMRLDSGHRLAATGWVNPRPCLMIRRHRLRNVSLADMVANNTITPTIASFLDAAVKANKSIVVSGAMGAGKTTMVRALCSAIDPWERIGTFETEYELHLNEMPDKHRRIVPWEARPGSGEFGPDGRRAGQIDLDQHLEDSFRFNLSRQIVGEVRGKEANAMIRAMQSGSGSISTTHSSHALETVDKLIDCVMDAGKPSDYATRVVTRAIDLVVHVTCLTRTDENGQGQRHRFVSEIMAVNYNIGAEDLRGRTYVFRQTPGQNRALANVMPDDLRHQLLIHGFDMDAFTREQAENPDRLGANE